MDDMGGLLFCFGNFVTIQSHAKWKKNRESCLHEGALFLEFHMAKSNIEMQRKRNRDGALNSYKIFVTIHSAESNLLL